MIPPPLNLFFIFILYKYIKKKNHTHTQINNGNTLQ